MATQEEWRRKLASYTPSWFSDPENVRVQAVLDGMAAMLAAFQQDIEDHVDQTFIGKSVGDFLDLHGSGRELKRFEDETDNQYRSRLRNYQSTTTCESLKSIVDAILTVGESRIVEGSELESFINGESFVGLNLTLSGENARNVFFSVRIDEQIPPPISFFGFSEFIGTDLYFGTLDAHETILNKIITAVEQSKAFGVAWELREGEFGSTDDQIARRDRVLALIEGPDGETQLAKGEFGVDEVPIEIRS